MKSLRTKMMAITIAAIVCLMPINSFAESQQTDNLNIEESYQIGTTVNAGMADGFKKNKEIKKGDPHYGWSLGDFYVSNYTEFEKKNGKIVFIKNVGDKVTLWFNLTQNIDALNGNDKLAIAYDKDNYDERFATDDAEFGRGALFIKYTNTNNKKDKVKEYYNYLDAKVSKDANTKVMTFEEGDYEVVLDYKIREAHAVIKDHKWVPTFTNYRTSFKFSVRNGNCMSYPIDIAGKGELANNGYTSKGFKVDFAKSKAVKVNCKREIKTSGESLDIRFSRPVKDGEEFTEPGIYTIITKNHLTKDKTVKKIFVGKEYVRQAETGENNWENMNNPKVLEQTEENIYNDLVAELNSEDYFVENVSAQYYSQEYIDEVAYNSQPNMYFGYTMAEIEKQFKGEKYIFTLGENGQTVVTQFKKGDDTYEKALKDVALGTGVILICVTVSVATGGTAPAVSMIFMASAKSGAVVAASSGAIGAVAAGITKGMESGDVEEALKAAAKTGGEEFKCGALFGVLLGGAVKASSLKGATLGGLTLNQAAAIQKESKYSFKIIKCIRSKAEYNVYKSAGLKQAKVGKKLALVRKIDPNRVDAKGMTNLQRMKKGKAPYDETGHKYQLHHIGQKKDSPLAILSWDEHVNNSKILHTAKKGIDHGNKWKKQRKAFWKAYAKMMDEI